MRHHNALPEIVFHTLQVDTAGSRCKQRCSSKNESRPDDIFHPGFEFCCPAYFEHENKSIAPPQSGKTAMTKHKVLVDLSKC